MKCAICDIETNGNDVRWGTEFAQAIPPAYTRYLAEVMMGHNVKLPKITNN